jgi:hypothetical protein
VELPSGKRSDQVILIGGTNHDSWQNFKGSLEETSAVTLKNEIIFSTLWVGSTVRPSRAVSSITS